MKLSRFVDRLCMAFCIHDDADYGYWCTGKRQRLSWGESWRIAGVVTK